MKQKFVILIAVLGLVGFTALGIANITNTHHHLQLKEIQLQDTGAKLKLLNDQYNNLLKAKSVDQQKLQQLEQQKKDLESQLQAKADATAAQQAKIANAASLSATAYAATPSVVPNCGDNSYAQYIYQHESGCNLNAVNSGGCRGIGQACPGSKLPCGADYACQNAWFSNYAVQRYGSWENAYYFWVANHYW